MFQYIKIFACAVLLAFSGTAIAQNKSLDSLQNAIKTYTKKDTVRVNLLNKAATKLFTTEADKALGLLKESASLADELNYKKGKAYSLLFTGNALITKPDYRAALDNFKESFAIYESLGDKHGMANCYFNFGRSYYYLGDFGKAETFYQKAITICEETGDLKRLSASLLGVGVIYSNRGDYIKGIETYNKALRLDEKSGNKKGIANTLTNLGNIYRKQGRFPLALEHYSRSLELKEQLGEQPGIATNLNNIGMVYEDMDKDEEAMQYYKRALTIFEKLNYRKEIQGALTNIGILYMNRGMGAEAMLCYRRALSISEELNDNYSKGNTLANIGSQQLLDKTYDEAIASFEKAIGLFKQLGVKNELAFSYLKMAKAYQAKKDFDKALKYANESAAIADKLGILEYQRDIKKLRAEVYYDTQNYKLAYENSAAQKKLNDSIFSKDNIDGMAQVKYKYEFKDSLNTAQATANTLKNTVKSKDAELVTSRRATLWWIAGSVCLLIVFGFVLALLKIRRVKMQNKQLLTEQKLLRSQMNPHFIFNSIQNIRSLIYSKREDEAVNYLNKFSRLTRQILETSNENYISLEEEVGIIKNYIAIQQLLYSNPFNYTLTVDEELEPESVFLPPMLTQPFIENAIKHGLAGRGENGQIDIRFFLKEGRLFFEVTDNGVGFDKVPKVAGHKSMAMDITKERLVNYTKNRDYTVQAGNITDTDKNVLGAKVVFEIPYIYEN